MEGLDLTLQSSLIPNSPYFRLLELQDNSVDCFTTNSQAGSYSQWIKEIVGDVVFGAEYQMIDVMTY